MSIPTNITQTWIIETVQAGRLDEIREAGETANIAEYYPTLMDAVADDSADEQEAVKALVHDLVDGAEYLVPQRIRSLRQSSSEAGDEAQVTICTAALAGEATAILECLRVLVAFDEEE